MLAKYVLWNIFIYIPFEILYVWLLFHSSSLFYQSEKDRWLTSLPGWYEYESSNVTKDSLINGAGPLVMW